MLNLRVVLQEFNPAVTQDPPYITSPPPTATAANNIQHKHTQTQQM